MKKFLLGAALISISVASPAMTKQALTLYMESGAEIVYFLDTKPNIGFKGQSMCVTVDHDSTEIPMTDVNRWEIGQVEYDDVKTVAVPDKVRISVEGEMVIVENPDFAEVNVYNLDGRLTATGSQQECIFHLSSGIYIVKIANESYKIAVR